MSSIEERLVRDIAAVTGGVIVNETELREAREELAGRIESSDRRHRRRTFVVTAAAAVGLVVAGVAVSQVLDDDGAAQPVAPIPGTGPVPASDDADYLTGEPLTPDLVDGVYRVDNGIVVLRFDAEGNVQFDDDGTLYSDPETSGTYEIDGYRMTVTITDDETSDCVGTTFELRASTYGPDFVRYVGSPADDARCPAVPLGRGTFERLLPTGRDLAAVDYADPRFWEPLTGPAELYGDWMAQGGGFLLELSRGGAYSVADESGELIDHGQWSLQGKNLTLASAAGSAECDGGDRLVLGSMQVQLTGTMIRGTVEKNACGGDWTPKTWFLMPNAGP